MRICLVLLSGTTSAATERHPDTFLDVVLKPLVSLLPLLSCTLLDPNTPGQGQELSLCMLSNEG